MILAQQCDTQPDKAMAGERQQVLLAEVTRGGLGRVIVDDSLDAASRGSCI
jgi:hypothetical protein